MGHTQAGRIGREGEAWQRLCGGLGQEAVQWLAESGGPESRWG